MGTYEYLYQVICASRSNKVLIFVEVDAKYIIVVSMDLFDVFARAQVPNTAGLISRAACKDAIVGWVPNSLVCSVLMHECTQCTFVEILRIPYFD